MRPGALQIQSAAMIIIVKQAFMVWIITAPYSQLHILICVTSSLVCLKQGSRLTVPGPKTPHWFSELLTCFIQLYMLLVDLKAP